MKIPRTACFRLVVLTLGAAALHSAWLFVETRRFEAGKAAIRAKGEPATLDDLAGAARRSRPDDEDACRYFHASAALLRPFPTRSNPFAHVAGDVAPSPAGLAWVRAAVDDNREAFEMLARAARCASCSCTERLPGNLATNALFRLVSLHAALRAFEGDGDDAAADLTTELRLSRMSPVGPGWSWFTLNLPIQDARIVLERSRPSSRALEGVRTIFGDAVDPHAAVLEEAQSMRVWASLPDGSASAYDGSPTFVDLLAEPWRLHVAAARLREATRVVDVARKPWPVDRQALDQLKAERLGILKPERPGMLSDNRAFLVALLDLATRIRCTDVALALARQRAEQGSVPASLAELPPGVDRQDPMTGAPLLYRAEGNRVTLWGVGANGRDDGGLVTGPLGVETPDWGISVVLR